MGCSVKERMVLVANTSPLRMGPSGTHVALLDFFYELNETAFLVMTMPPGSGHADDCPPPLSCFLELSKWSWRPLKVSVCMFWWDFSSRKEALFPRRLSFPLRCLSWGNREVHCCAFLWMSGIPELLVLSTDTAFNTHSSAGVKENWGKLHPSLL